MNRDYLAPAQEQVNDCDFCLDRPAAKYYAYGPVESAFKCCFKCWIARKNIFTYQITEQEYKVYLLDALLSN